MGPDIALTVFARGAGLPPFFMLADPELLRRRAALLGLDVAIAACSARAIRHVPADGDHLSGKLQARRYFFDYELPKVDAWLGVVSSRNPTCREMREEWYYE